MSPAKEQPAKAAPAKTSAKAAPAKRVKSATSNPSFDRIKPAPSAQSRKAPVVDAREDDVQGKRALFSGAEQPPSTGSAALECSRCNRRSVVSYVRLAKMWVVGFYVPLPGLSQRAWIKCPACQHHAWVTISIKA